MRMVTLQFLMLTACTNMTKDSGQDSAEADVSLDSGQDTDNDDDSGSTNDSGLPSGLSGTEPSADIPVPEFTATSHDGSSRTSADLLGHPTVMWFFPAAATPG